MTKIFKKTFAFFIAVIMMISSFPYMALAEDSASATEGSTTVEMTNEDLEKYIDSKIDNASLTLPEQQLVATADKEYMSGIYTKASLDTSPVFTEIPFNGNLTFRLATSKLRYAVAIYTGQNDDIRFPVVFCKYFYDKSDKTPCYFRYVSIPQNVDNFQFIKEWQRCKTLTNLTYDSDPQNFSSQYDGDHLTDNSFAMGQNKFWRNYIKYTGSGDKDKYYEVLPDSLNFGLQYKTDNKVTGSVKLEHTAYVLNLAPYKNILDKIKSEYAQIKENSSLYTEESVNNYYKAVRDILDFDIGNLLSNMTLNSKIFSKEIADIATKVKTVVENYNSAKELLLDFTAYDAAKEQCETIINNQTNTNEYESKSFEEFKKTYGEVIAKAKTVKTQKELNDLTAQLITAQTMLRKNKITITFKIYKNDSSEPYYNRDSDSDYGVRHFFETNIDKAKECVKRWIIYTDGGKTRTVVGTTDSMFTLYVTMDATIEAYVVPLKENAKPEEYSKVVFYGFNNRVIDVQYLKKGETLDKYTTKAPDVPFYQFDSWDKTSVTGTGEDIVVKAKYTPKQVATDGCTVYYTGFKDGKKTYSYDSFVSLGAKDNEYFALATTADGKNADDSSSILTYLNCNEFHAPKRSEIYVVPVNKDDRVAKVAVTGSYATKIDKDGNIASETNYTKNRAVFNCKFYVPEDCERLVEWGAQISANGKTRVVKGEKPSKHNEYSIYMNVSKDSTIKEFTAVAYVRYLDTQNKIKTIYSESARQAFN